MNKPESFETWSPEQQQAWLNHRREMRRKWLQANLDKTKERQLVWLKANQENGKAY